MNEEKTPLEAIDPLTDEELETIKEKGIESAEDLLAKLKSYENAPSEIAGEETPEIHGIEKKGFGQNVAYIGIANNFKVKGKNLSPEMDIHMSIEGKELFEDKENRHLPEKEFECNSDNSDSAKISFKISPGIKLDSSKEPGSFFSNALAHLMPHFVKKYGELELWLTDRKNIASNSWVIEVRNESRFSACFHPMRHPFLFFFALMLVAGVFLFRTHYLLGGFYLLLLKNHFLDPLILKALLSYWTLPPLLFFLQFYFLSHDNNPNTYLDNIAIILILPIFLTSLCLNADQRVSSSNFIAQTLWKRDFTAAKVFPKLYDWMDFYVVDQFRGYSLEDKEIIVQLRNIEHNNAASIIIEKKVLPAEIPGTIVNQIPDAGEVINKGSGLNLVVAADELKKPIKLSKPVIIRTLQVPNYKGLVFNKISGYRSNLVRTFVPVERCDNHGVVLAQEPAAGTKIEPGDHVRLEVGSKDCGDIIARLEDEIRKHASNTIIGDSMNGITFQGCFEEKMDKKSIGYGSEKFTLTLKYKHLEIFSHGKSLGLMPDGAVYSECLVSNYCRRGVIYKLSKKVYEYFQQNLSNPATANQFLRGLEMPAAKIHEQTLTINTIIDEIIDDLDKKTDSGGE